MGDINILLYLMMFTGIYGKAALDTLGVINAHPANSRPDIPLLLLRAPI